MECGSASSHRGQRGSLGFPGPHGTFDPVAHCVAVVQRMAIDRAEANDLRLSTEDRQAGEQGLSANQALLQMMWAHDLSPDQQAVLARDPTVLPWLRECGLVG
jgi:hypothetical protein